MLFFFRFCNNRKHEIPIPTKNVLSRIQFIPNMEYSFVACDKLFHVNQNVSLLRFSRPKKQSRLRVVEMQPKSECFRYGGSIE